MARKLITRLDLHTAARWRRWRGGRQVLEDPQTTLQVAASPAEMAFRWFYGLLALNGVSSDFWAFMKTDGSMAIFCLEEGNKHAIL